MRQLIYLSRATRDFGHSEIERLVDDSSRRNRPLGITGLLIFDGRRFIQALEGSADAVTATMDRIRRDHRHEYIVQMSCRWIMERQFGHWAMAGRILTSAEEAEDFYQDMSSYLADKITDPETFAAFLGFASLGRAPFRDTLKRFNPCASRLRVGSQASL